jgi:hypothetical protein
MNNTEIVFVEKQDKIVNALKQMAIKEFGAMPEQGNNIGVLCLYGPGTISGWQPDGLVIKFDERTKTLNYHEYVMNAKGELEGTGSTMNSAYTPKDKIIKAVATGVLSDQEMAELRKADLKGRFTDWNQQLLMKKAEEIHLHSLMNLKHA